MTTEQFVLAIITTNLAVEFFKWLIGRARSRADIRLVGEQSEHESADAADVITSAADRVVVILHKQMDRLNAHIEKLESRVDTLETALARSDYALTYLVKHPAIRKSYPTQVDKAMKIRRGDEKWDDETPILFDIPKSEST